MLREPGVICGPEEAEMMAISALTFLAGEPEALSRFLALSGISVATLRESAADPAFLAGILDFLLAHEAWLLAFTGAAGIPPARVADARRALSKAG